MKQVCLPFILRRAAPPAVLAAALAGLLHGGQAQAGAFKLPTGGAAAWGRAQAGGSLYPDDPTVQYNNPAGLAFLSGPMSEGTTTLFHLDTRYHGSATSPNIGGVPGTGTLIDGSHPQAGDNIPFGNGSFGMPIGDRFGLGFGFQVPYALQTTYGNNANTRDAAIDTKLQSIAISVAGAWKVNDEFSIGAGLVGQRTHALLSEQLDLGNILTASPTGITAPPDLFTGKININQHRWGYGYYAGFEWLPSTHDRFGFSYHSRIGQTLHGNYKMYGFSEQTSQLLLYAPALHLPAINPDGSKAKATGVDTPAFANIDYVHFFDSGFSVAASVEWQDWSDFKQISLIQQGDRLFTIPEKFHDSFLYALGGEYQFRSDWVARLGVSLDQSPTTTETRDPRLPDYPRRIVATGIGHTIGKWKLDAGYQHVFVKNTPIHLNTPDVTGGVRLDGKQKSSSDILSVTATYKF